MSTAMTPDSSSNSPEYGLIGLPSSAISRAATLCSVHATSGAGSNPAVSSNLALTLGGVAITTASHSISLPEIRTEDNLPDDPRVSDSAVLPELKVTPT